MPIPEKALEPRRQPSNEEHFQRYPLSATSYHLFKGMTHGALTAVFCGVLNPIERIHAQLAISGKTGLAVNVQNPSSSFLRKTVKFMRHAVFSEPMWRGTLYSITTNVPRNALIFPSWPLIKEKLKNQGYDPLQTAMISGMSVGSIDSLLTARTRLVKSVINISDNVITPKQIKTNLKNEGQQITGILHAWKWGAVRGGLHWSIYPIIAKGIEKGVNFAIDYTGFQHSSFARMINYSISGAFAGACTAFITYPLSLAETRALVNHYQHHTLSVKRENQINTIYHYYCKHGLMKTVTEKTHRGIVVTSVPRMAGIGLFFNLALHSSEWISQRLFETEHADKNKSIKSKP